MKKWSVCVINVANSIQNNVIWRNIFSLSMKKSSILVINVANNSHNKLIRRHIINKIVFKGTVGNCIRIWINFHFLVLQGRLQMLVIVVLNWIYGSVKLTFIILFLLLDKISSHFTLSARIHKTSGAGALRCSGQLTEWDHVVAVLTVVSYPEEVEPWGLHAVTVPLMLRIYRELCHLAFLARVVKDEVRDSDVADAGSIMP